MARARNIKPAFFDNDELAENDPLGRLLFIGLWTLADYQGNLEWRPKRIQKQILAYDKCDIDKLAINLDKSGFIRFYSDGDNLFVNILNFTKHQNPHKNERDKGSEILDYSDNARQLVDLKGLTINRDLSGLERNSSTSNPADSLILIPDSLSLIPEPLTPASRGRFTPPTLEEVFQYCNERCNNVDAQNFLDHYETNGWMRGKAKIKDWKACVRTWEKNAKQSNNGHSDVVNQSLENLKGGW